MVMIEMKITINEWSGRNIDIDTEKLLNKNIANDIEILADKILNHIKNYLNEE